MLRGECHCGGAAWELAKMPERATSCSCTVCRRYGALWAYGELGVDVEVRGETKVYVREDIQQHLAFHFCGRCGAVVCWLPIAEKGSRRCAVNLRLAEAAEVADLPVHRWDGFDTWQTVESDGRRVRDVWF